MTSDSQRTPSLAVLLSGTGRTLVNLADHIEQGALRARIALVIASRPCLGAELAQERNISTRIMEGDLSADALGEALRDAGAQWVALAGYLRLLPIPPGFEGRIINIHPALLPDFGGAGMHGMRVHRAVLEAGRSVSGCTAHLCDERYDTGPIILQRRCPVLEDDTPQTLADRVFALEREVYPEAIELLFSGRAPIKGQSRISSS